MMIGVDWRVEGENSEVWHSARPLDPKEVCEWLAAYSQHAPPLSARERVLLPRASAIVWPEVLAGLFRNASGEVFGREHAATYMQSLVNLDLGDLI